MAVKKTPANNNTQPEIGYETYADFVFMALRQAESSIRRQIVQDPRMSNTLMKEINNSAMLYTTAQIADMIKHPYNHEQELRDLSQYFQYAISPYNRTLDHFTKILLYYYDMRPLSPPPINTSQITSYLNGKERCYNWLRKLRLREQFEDVTKTVMTDGAKFVFVRESSDYVALQAMPIYYCKITGRTDLGYTYSFDMSFFDKYGDKYLSVYAPEFTSWYADVQKLRKANPNEYNTWVPMPPEKAFVFKFDDTNAAVIPPLTGVFEDAVQIVEYKNIMKARAILDVFAIVFQKIPLDKDGKKPIMGPKDAAGIAAAVEQALPAGAHTVASPFEPELITFSKPSGEKSIIPDGVLQYWQEVGVSGQQYGGGDKGAVAQKYSNIADYGYVRQLYAQYERFTNFCLSQRSKAHKFGIRLYGNLYTNLEDIKTEKELVAQGFPVNKLAGMDGYDPWDLEYLVADETITGIKQKMIPPVSMYQPQSSTDSAGRPSKPLEQLENPSSEGMREEAGSGAEAL
jgi:hypothetical protein